MEDERIIDLYWQRSQEAISRTDEKYGRLCTKISLNILSVSYTHLTLPTILRV